MVKIKCKMCFKMAVVSCKVKIRCKIYGTTNEKYANQNRQTKMRSFLNKQKKICPFHLFD